LSSERGGASWDFWERKGGVYSVSTERLRGVVSNGVARADAGQGRGGKKGGLDCESPEEGKLAPTSTKKGEKGGFKGPVVSVRLANRAEGEINGNYQC